MTVLQDLTSHLIQEGHVDELTLVGKVVGPLHSVWVALSTGLVGTMVFMDTGIITMVLIVNMWMVCL